MPTPQSKTNVIQSGTFLNAFCPFCDSSMNEGNHVVFNITNYENVDGILRLSPYLNVFSNESTIKIPERMSVIDIKCTHCKRSLILADKRCPDCNSRIARIKIKAMNRKIDFYICSLKGCKWHGLNNAEIQDVILEDSEEW